MRHPRKFVSPAPYMGEPAIPRRQWFSELGPIIVVTRQGEDELVSEPFGSVTAAVMFAMTTSAREPGVAWTEVREIRPKSGERSTDLIARYERGEPV